MMPMTSAILHQVMGVGYLSMQKKTTEEDLRRFAIESDITKVENSRLLIPGNDEHIPLYHMKLSHDEYIDEPNYASNATFGNVVEIQNTHHEPTNFTTQEEPALMDAAEVYGMLVGTQEE